jgi:hypothetical protein
MNKQEEIKQLDKYYPPCGECMHCGFKDKRHRLWDAWINSTNSDESIAQQWNVDIEYVRLVRKIRPYN